MRVEKLNFGNVSHFVIFINFLNFVIGVILNSSTNWLIYGIYGSRFRTEVKETALSLMGKEESSSIKVKSIVTTVPNGTRENELYENIERVS